MKGNMEDIQYLEDNIDRRNREISRLYSKLNKIYSEIDELKEYNRRDKTDVMEAIKSEFLKKINLNENEDLRSLFVVFNNKVEYVETVRLNDFSGDSECDTVSENLDNKIKALEEYLKENKLYANSASDFANKELKWYKKSFKDMVLKLGWKVNEDGLLTDLEW